MKSEGRRLGKVGKYAVRSGKREEEKGKGTMINGERKSKELRKDAV